MCLVPADICMHTGWSFWIIWSWFTWFGGFCHNMILQQLSFHHCPATSCSIVCVPPNQMTRRLPPLPRSVYLHSLPRITCHSAATIHPFPPIAWLALHKGAGTGLKQDRMRKTRCDREEGFTKDRKHTNMSKRTGDGDGGRDRRSRAQRGEK